MHLVFFFRKINKNCTRHLRLAFSIVQHWTIVWSSRRILGGTHTTGGSGTGLCRDCLINQVLKIGHRPCLETSPERSRAAMCVLPSILSSKKTLPFPSSSPRLISSLPSEMWQPALAHSGSIPLLQRGFWVVLEKLWASVKSWVLARTQNASIPILHFLHLGNYSNNCESSSRRGVMAELQL